LRSFHTKKQLGGCSCPWRHFDCLCA